MNIGTAQLEITPRIGIPLSGFAVRSQPSTGILDPLWIRALYLEDEAERLLWLHADLLALDQRLVEHLRYRLEKESGIPFSRIVLSTTHTHGAPAAIQLTGCGEIDPAYVTWLEEQFSRAARIALNNPEPCRLVVAQGHCELGVDRRNSAALHTDPRVGALGWCRNDGTFKAAFLSYSMHPVCLRNSLISADWPGEAARVLSEKLPGRPVVLISSGACGNINPPETGVAAAQMQRWGQQIAESVLTQLITSRHESAPNDSLKVSTTKVLLPSEPWGCQEIESYAAACLTDPGGQGEFGEIFKRVVEIWRDNLIGQLERGKYGSIEAQLTAVSLGPVTLLTVNAEIFSQFAELACPAGEFPVYVLGCVNGMIGYVVPAEAYDEGGYEVAWSMLFYNLPRPKKGGFELLARHARQLLIDHGAVALEGREAK